VTRLLSAGSAQRAVQLLAERRAPDGTSLSPSLEIEALEALGDLPAATAMARDNRRAASIGTTSRCGHLHPAPRAPAGAQRHFKFAGGSAGRSPPRGPAPTVDRLRI